MVGAPALEPGTRRPRQKRVSLVSANGGSRFRLRSSSYGGQVTKLLAHQEFFAAILSERQAEGRGRRAACAVRTQG
jgi:hypothetical protein